MFRKKIETKASALLRTTEKKKFRNSVASAFFPGQDDGDSAMPAELRESLGKGEVSLIKAAAESKQFEFYSLDKTPIFFILDGKLFPTVYLLWTHPTMLPRLYTHPSVFEVLKTGADLMLPGVASSSSFDFQVDAVCAICLIGNDAPVAVGRALMSGQEMLSSESRKGKAVHILHWDRDYLWELGPKLRAPVISLPDDSVEKDCQSTLAEDLETLSVISNEASARDKDVDQLATAAVDNNDTMFLLYFLYALRKRLRHDDDLPVLASTFYGTMLLPTMPPEEDKKITIQRTSYKKFSAFLRHMQEQGVVYIDEPKKGVENITRVSWDHEIFRQYSDQLKSLPTADTISSTDNDASVINERPVNFREMRAITAPVLPLFQTVNQSLKKGQALGAVDVRAVISSYVKSKELSSGRMVKLDDLLLSNVATKADGRKAGDLISWEILMESIFDRMTPCVEVEYADRGESSRKEIHKGKPPSIRLKVAKRAGNKKVTLVDNIGAFGIDPKAFAQELQVALAVSSTVNHLDNERAQVQVQGDQASKLQKILTDKGIAKKHVIIDP